jgi:hypothetical protein
MIPHDVKSEIGLEPLTNGGHFSRDDITVDIPAHKSIDQRVQHHQESPHSRIESLDERTVDHIRSDTVDVAEIDIVLMLDG